MMMLKFRPESSIAQCGLSVAPTEKQLFDCCTVKGAKYKQNGSIEQKSQKSPPRASRVRAGSEKRGLDVSDKPEITQQS